MCCHPQGHRVTPDLATEQYHQSKQNEVSGHSSSPTTSLTCGPGQQRSTLNPWIDRTGRRVVEKSEMPGREEYEHPQQFFSPRIFSLVLNLEAVLSARRSHQCCDATQEHYDTEVMAPTPMWLPQQNTNFTNLWSWTLGFSWPPFVSSYSFSNQLIAVQTDPHLIQWASGI